MPNSVFGYCRCRCPEHFSGPKCQFVSKRVASRLSVGGATTKTISSNDNDRGFTPASLLDIINQLHGKQRLRHSLTDLHAD